MRSDALTDSLQSKEAHTQMLPIDTMYVSAATTNKSTDMSRRRALIGGAVIAAGMSLPRAASALLIEG